MTALDVMLPRVDAVTTVRYALIYLRLSDFRDEDDDGTFTVREAELRELAAGLGLTVLEPVVVENDLRSDGKLRSASAFKTPRKVVDGNGLITRRTNRGKFTGVLLALQRHQAQVLIAGDESRLSREERDGLDLADVVKSSGASVIVPDEDGEPKWVFTNGGTAREMSTFMDKVSDGRKYSQDVSAKVKKGRKRWAGKSYQGGRRPFGFRIAEGTKEHQRNLVLDEREAKVLRDAADAILDRDISLKSIARDLREAAGDAYVPTVSGAVWSGSILRDVLAKPATAGLAVGRDGALIPAPWSAIVPVDRWERLVALFESRKTGTSNEPKWLVSLIATCGICKDATMRVTGSASRRAYVCSRHGHLRRSAPKVDELVAARVVALLKREAPHLLEPLPRQDVDTGALRAEAKKLTERKAALARVFAADGDETALTAGMKIIRDRLAVIDSQLAASDVTDPLPEFRDPAADVLAVWDSLGLARQRAIVKLLYDIEILPMARKGGNVFDEDSVQMTRKV
jgi:DNA invertase Pin-like site-specific DNA recombinase